MADLALRIKSDFEQAEKDFASLAASSDYAKSKIEKFTEKFKTDSIDRFTDRNKLAAAAATATGGKMAGMQKEAAGLKREMERLIKSGLSPQDPALRKLQADYTTLSKDIEANTKTTKKATGAQQAFVNILKTAAVYFSARAIMQFTKDIIAAASDVEELGNKYGVVFAGIEAETNQWLSDYSTATARGINATKEFLTSLQDIQTGFGDTVANAAEFSKAVVGVTNDLSSFSNIDFETASQAIQSGLSGQFRALQQLGVGLNVNIINQGKYAESIGKTWKEMSNLEKREAVLSGIMEQSKNAIGQNVSVWQDYNYALGDAANTSDAYENQGKLLSQSMTDLYAVLGGVLLPTVTEFITSINENINSFIQWASTGDNLSSTLSTIGDILIVVGSAFIAYNAYVIAAGIANGIYTAACAASATGTFTFAGAVTALNTAMNLNPIGLIIAGVVALVAAIILLRKNWDIVQIAMLKGFEYLKIGLLYMSKAVVAATAVLFAPFLVGINLIITAFNKITGKNIPTVMDGFKKLNAGIDGQIEKSKGKIAELDKKHAEVMRTRAENSKKSAAEINESENARVANGQKNTEALAAQTEAEKAKNKERVESYKQMLEQITLSQQGALNQMTADATNFFTQRAAIEGLSHEERMAYLQQQYEDLAKLQGLSADQRLATEQGLAAAIKKEQENQIKMYMDFTKETISTTKSMFDDLATTMENAGKSGRKFAMISRALAIADAGINAHLAASKSLAAYPWPLNLVAAGISYAAGAARIAAISSTKIPSAQTGGEFTIPDTPATRNDGARIAVQGGEKVNVTPRGEDSGRTTEVNISIGEFQLFKIIQKGIDTGKINVSDRNIGSGVFA